MKQFKIAREAMVSHPQRAVESRHIPRVPVSFGLMYSGLSNDEVLMGDGTVFNLSKHGLGIRGNQPVRVGMELALFLYLPDGDDPLFVLEARVVWTDGRQFGVEYKKPCLREGDRLQAFLLAQRP